MIKRPLVAVIGRPNVGKSTLVNRMCDIADVVGGIAHDEVSVTHDRTYKQATHTDDCGDTFLFDVIDTGGLVFEDNLDTWHCLDIAPLHSQIQRRPFKLRYLADRAINAFRCMFGPSCF